LAISEDYALKSEEEYKSEISKIKVIIFLVNYYQLDLGKVKHELNETNDNFNKKLSESPQVTNLKNIIKQKNE